MFIESIVKVRRTKKTYTKILHTMAEVDMCHCKDIDIVHVSSKKIVLLMKASNPSMSNQNPWPPRGTLFEVLRYSDQWAEPVEMLVGDEGGLAWYADELITSHLFIASFQMSRVYGV
jgi:hypothetical protein